MMKNFAIDIRTCTEEEKTNLLAEFKGQLIDIFEDFLDRKGIVIPNTERDEDEDLDPEESANIYGSDYDELADGLIDVLEHWGLMKPEITVNTPAGQLVAYADTTSAGIMLRPMDYDQDIDVALAEVQSEELRNGTDIGENDVVCYKWDDPFTEDYTQKTILRRKDIEQALKE